MGLPRLFARTCLLGLLIGLSPPGTRGIVGPAATVEVAAQTANASFSQWRFELDWLPGTRDRSGRLMTGTETTYLVAHGGRLYAAVGVWNIDPRTENPGPAVLVKTAADAAWSVDLEGGARNVRIASLASIELSTDGQGRPLEEPVQLLMAGVGGFGNRDETSVYVRDDSTGSWDRSVVARGAPGTSREVRLLFDHRDEVTGVHHVFATSAGAIYRGVYDPAAVGRVRWSAEPELGGRLARIMSAGSANGQAYVAVDITPDSPGNGGLFRRVDGEARWAWQGEWGSRTDHIGVAWIRGLTAIPDPERPGEELLLASREVDGVIERIHPREDHRPVLDFDVAEHFRALAGAAPDTRITTIFAYNEMTPATDPHTGEQVLLIGGGVFPPTLWDEARAKRAWLLVRGADGRYRSVEVHDPAHDPPALGGLRPVRTICASPFPEEAGRVWYLGGFDAAQGPHAGTAWIYRGTLAESEAAEPDFEIVDEVVQALDLDVIDSEFSEEDRSLAWQARDDTLRVTPIDPATGDIQWERTEVVDDMLPFRLTANSAEIAYSRSRGTHVLFHKQTPQGQRVAQAYRQTGDGDGGGGEWVVKTLDLLPGPHDSRVPFGSQVSAWDSPLATVLVQPEGAAAARRAWVDVEQPERNGYYPRVAGREPLIAVPVISDRPDVPRFMGLLYTVGGVNQMHLYDTDSRALEQITFDTLHKTPGAIPFTAPDHGSRMALVSASTSQRQHRRGETLAFHLQTAAGWAEQARFRPPTSLPYLHSVEPFVFDGVSYVSYFATDGLSFGEQTRGEIWFSTIDGRFHRKVSSPAFESGEGEIIDPESFVTETTVFIYYTRRLPNGNRITHRAQSGLRRSMPSPEKATVLHLPIARRGER